MDAEAPILAAVRASLRFGGLRTPGDVFFEVHGGKFLSVMRRRKRDLEIPTLRVDRGPRVGLSAARFGRATAQGGVVLDTTATALAENGLVKEPDLGGNAADRGSVDTLKLHKRRKRRP